MNKKFALMSMFNTIQPSGYKRSASGVFPLTCSDSLDERATVQSLTLGHKRLYNGDLYDESAIGTTIPDLSPDNPLPIVTSGSGFYTLGQTKLGYHTSGGVTVGVKSRYITVISSANTGLFFVRLNDGATATTFNGYLALKNNSGFELPANVEYTVKVTQVSGTSSNVSFPAVAVLFADTTSDAATRKVLYPYNGVTTLTFTRASAIKAVIIGVNATGVTAGNCTFKIDLISTRQFETGAKAQITASQTVSPFSTVNYSFPFTAKDPAKQSLINNALTINTYKSLIFHDEGKDYCNCKTGFKVFDGTENWATNQTHPNTISFFLTPNIGTPSNENRFCNYYRCYNWNTGFSDLDTEGCWNANTSYGFRILKSRLSTVDAAGFKAYLAELYAAGKPLTVYYVLATPEVVEIEPLTKIRTFDTETIFESNDINTTNTAPTETTIKYQYGGQTLPINPIFAENTWTIIFSAFRNGIASNFWSVGDTKPVTLTDGRQYTIRIADMTTGRYALASGSGSTNGVLEFVECINMGGTTSFPINSSTKEGYWAGGGWAACDMHNTTMASLYNLLPADMQAAISEISTTEYSYTSPTPRTTTSKLFLPAETEIFDARHYSAEGVQTGCVKYSQFGYYAAHKTNADRIKKTVDTTSARWWWLRSPYSGNNSRFCVVDSDGSFSNDNAGGDYYGVSPCFAI